MKLANFFFAVVAATQIGATKPDLVRGIDHAPVAVRDLDHAAGDYARMGFVIKPGRPHDNGLRNRHVKFPNGGGIELITVASPRDALAETYAKWLSGGEGPAFVGLYSPAPDALTAALVSEGLRPIQEDGLVSFPPDGALRWLFFGGRLKSPTDGPAYWAHANTAYRLQGVWLTDRPEARRLLLRLGAKRKARDTCAPFDRRADVYVLPGEHDEVMIGGENRSMDRTIIGLTVMVRSLATAQRILRANGVPHLRSKCGDGLWVKPEAASQVWLELREGRQDAP